MKKWVIAILKFVTRQFLHRNSFLIDFDDVYLQDVLVLCHDSDVEFWADMSEGEETDTELTDAVRLHTQYPNSLMVHYIYCE